MPTRAGLPTLPPTAQCLEGTSAHQSDPPAPRSPTGRGSPGGCPGTANALSRWGRGRALPVPARSPRCRSEDGRGTGVHLEGRGGEGVGARSGLTPGPGRRGRDAQTGRPRHRLRSTPRRGRGADDDTQTEGEMPRFSHGPRASGRHWAPEASKGQTLCPRNSDAEAAGSGRRDRRKGEQVPAEAGDGAPGARDGRGQRRRRGGAHGVGRRGGQTGKSRPDHQAKQPGLSSAGNTVTSREAQVCTPVARAP